MAAQGRRQPAPDEGEATAGLGQVAGDLHRGAWDRRSLSPATIHALEAPAAHHVELGEREREQKVRKRERAEGESEREQKVRERERERESRR